MRTVHWLFVVSVMSGIGFVIAGARTTRDAPHIEDSAAVPVASVMCSQLVTPSTCRATTVIEGINVDNRIVVAVITVALLAGVLVGEAAAHGVSGKDAAFLQSVQGDGIIGFSVVYKAFDNMDGFTRFFGFQPNTRLADLGFGLFHGFGLATKLQDFALSPDGLVTNIVSFNVGVEIGQVIALTFVLLALGYWRTRSGFLRHAFATNAALMACGFLLVGYQVSGYFLGA